MHAARSILPSGFTFAVRATNEAGIRARFERALEAAVCDALGAAGASPLSEQVRWHFGIGSERSARRGKRIRPRLLLQIARDEGATFESALDAALAVELLHNYSLVHDDIEDGDELRHGRQTVWARFGVSHGINAGDALGSICYLALLRNSAGAPVDRVAAMTHALQAANLAMCAGQAYDIGFETSPFVTMDAYLAMIEGKTAALFGAACELGALSAGSDAGRARSYRDLGRAYGRAFQIRDDVLGMWGSREETGKARGADIARRKWSFPIVWSLAGPASAARDAIAAGYAGRESPTPAGVAAIVAALDELGAQRVAEDAWRSEAEFAARLALAHDLDRGARLPSLFAAGCASRGGVAF